jgi:hypothetical protein
MKKLTLILAINILVAAFIITALYEPALAAVLAVIAAVTRIMHYYITNE